jgi:hypothetical protein
MNALDSNLQCRVVSALEEQIWLDRRETACLVFPARREGLARLTQWLRELRTRMQLGPLDDAGGWIGSDPETRF